MSFCDALQAAINEAPDDEVKAELQLIYDRRCGGVHTQGGPVTFPDPPKPHPL